MKRSIGPRTNVLFALLGALTEDKRHTQSDLAAQLQISKSTVTRLLSEARTTFGMRIEWKDGRYQIEDWGTFDPHAIKRGKAPYKVRP